jgi:hypothetical protein
MPDIWDTDSFRERSRTWQERSEALPPGIERKQCMAIAEGYARLAQLKAKIDLADAGYEEAPATASARKLG